jgi:TrmH family RNA methyltransferase
LYPGSWAETDMTLNQKLKRYGRDLDYSYCYGVFPTLELITYQPGSILAVLLHSKGDPNQGITKIRQACSNYQIELIENDRLFEKLSDRGNTFAIGVFNKSSSELSQQANHIVLVNPSSMGNLGTIVRSMLGFGYTDLAIIEPAADHFDPKVIRASMGAIFQTRVWRFQTFPDYWGSYGKHQLYPLMTNGKISLPDVIFQTPHSLVFGSEASGLDNEFLDYGTSIRIPQEQQVDSLNLALAVGVTMYQSWINTTQIN